MPSSKPRAVTLARTRAPLTTRSRAPSLFIRGSVDIGMILDALRAQIACSWAASLTALSQQVLDHIWYAQPRRLAPICAPADPDFPVALALERLSIQQAAAAPQRQACGLASSLTAR